MMYWAYTRVYLALHTIPLQVVAFSVGVLLGYIRAMQFESSGSEKQKENNMEHKMDTKLIHGAMQAGSAI